MTPSGFPVPWDPPPPAPHTQPPASGSLGGPLGCARGRPGGLPASRLVLLFAGRSPSRNHPQGQCPLLPLPWRLPCVLGGRGLPPGCACACVLLRVAPCLLVMWALKSRFLWPRPLPGPGPAQQLSPSDRTRGASRGAVLPAPAQGLGCSEPRATQVDTPTGCPPDTAGQGQTAGGGAALRRGLRITPVRSRFVEGFSRSGRGSPSGQGLLPCFTSPRWGPVSPSLGLSRPLRFCLL